MSGVGATMAAALAAGVGAALRCGNVEPELTTGLKAAFPSACSLTVSTLVEDLGSVVSVAGLLQGHLRAALMTPEASPSRPCLLSGTPCVSAAPGAAAAGGQGPAPALLCVPVRSPAGAPRGAACAVELAMAPGRPLDAAHAKALLLLAGALSACLHDSVAAIVEGLSPLLTYGHPPPRAAVDDGDGSDGIDVDMDVAFDSDGAVDVDAYEEQELAAASRRALGGETNIDNDPVRRPAARTDSQNTRLCDDSLPPPGPDCAGGAPTLAVPLPVESPRTGAVRRRPPAGGGSPAGGPSRFCGSGRSSLDALPKGKLPKGDVAERQAAELGQATAIHVPWLRFADSDVEARYLYWSNLRLSLAERTSFLLMLVLHISTLALQPYRNPEYWLLGLAPAAPLLLALCAPRAYCRWRETVLCALLLHLCLYRAWAVRRLLGEVGHEGAAMLAVPLDGLAWLAMTMVLCQMRSCVQAPLQLLLLLVNASTLPPLCAALALRGGALRGCVAVRGVKAALVTVVLPLMGLYRMELRSRRMFVANGAAAPQHAA